MNKFLLLSLLACIWTLSGHAQQVPLQIKAAGNQVDQAVFEIVEVVDARKKSGSLGRVYTGAGIAAQATLSGGLEQALQTYFQEAINPTGKATQIQIKVEELSIAEKTGARNTVAGELTMKFNYAVKGSFEPVHLVGFEGGLKYQRSLNRTDMVEGVVKQALDKSIAFFDEWIRSQSASDNRLAKSVRLQLMDHPGGANKDTVFYSEDRPLVWGDFTDRPSSRSSFNAAIFTSFSMEGNPYVEDGEIVLPVEIKVYMLPGSSWVRGSGQNDYSLNHEQRHFDLVKVVADRLRDRLQHMELDPEDYDGSLNQAFFDAYREMNQWQEIYDAQTQHGLKRNAQENWNLALDQALKGEWAGIEQLVQKRK
ncbi:DUF922 domain-containing protein [Pararhodonellum marinum]|uniref:DUF922 domain-containing protein n=1 Tax=Pararhodonellum marinum TaxID=2755358 RepID=UPI00188F0331|nr:DUF922 domain-containing protein [Pararhodonellum marinum]